MLAHDPFGNPIPASAGGVNVGPFAGVGNGLFFGATPSPFGWNAGSGYQNDFDTGLVYVGNRYYDPSAGRFISQDPAGSGTNWYAYCGNSPLNGSDPTGLHSTIIDDISIDAKGETVGYHLIDGAGNWTGTNGVIYYRSDDLGMTSGETTEALTAGAANALTGMTFGLYTNQTYHNYPGAAFSRGSGAVGAVALAAAGGVAVAGSRAAVGAASAFRALACPLLARFGMSICFGEGTPIQMADGTIKPIEQIKVGDVVLSRDYRDDGSGPVVARKVAQTFQHQTSAILVLTFSDGERIVTTEAHPFFVAGAGWTAAGKLAIGTQIVTRAGPQGMVQVISIERRVLDKPVSVYNFEVEGTHTYFVGSVGTGVWVHNDCDYEAIRSQLHMVDENLPPSLAASLQRAGVNAISQVRFFGTTGIKDPAIIQALTQAGGKIITKNVADFPPGMAVGISGGNATRTAAQMFEQLKPYFGL